MATSYNIYERINKIRQKVAYVKKDVNVDKKYNAVTHDEVTARCREAMIEQGVIMEMELLEHSSETTKTTDSGYPSILFTAVYRVWFVNMHNPEERAHVDAIGQGYDFGDKAPGKAMSYAAKYGMLKMFNLETGENEESRIKIEEKSRLIDEDEIVKLREFVKNSGRTDEEFFEYLNRINPGGDKLSKYREISYGLYQLVIKTVAEKHGDKPSSGQTPETAASKAAAKKAKGAENG